MSIDLASPHEHLIKVDTEHFSIRFLVPVLTVFLVVVLHLAGTLAISSQIESDASPTCIMLPVDVVLLFVIGYTIERILKRLLPSRRSATLSETALVVTDARRKPASVKRIAWDQAVNVKAWRFPVTRRTRVPKGWYCMAVHLLQDEEEVILYTFMSPPDAEKVIGYRNFARLRPRKETQSNTDLKAVAEQRRLLKLEDARWYDGAEIAREDFNALLAVLQRCVPGWSS